MGNVFANNSTKEVSIYGRKTCGLKMTTNKKNNNYKNVLFGFISLMDHA